MYNSSDRIILVSAHLDRAEKKIRYFELLDVYLRQFQFRLFLINLDITDIKTDCEYANVPPYGKKMLREESRHFIRTGDLSPELVAAATVDADFHDINILSAAARLLLYKSFVRRLLFHKKPYLCILWNQSIGIQRVLATECKEQGVPVIFVEYGLLPGTIVLEDDGQMAESRVTQQSEEFMSLSLNENDLAIANRYLKYAREEKLTRKPQTNKESIQDIVKKSRQKGRKIIFYAGQNDCYSGMKPIWLPEARIHSPLFVHTLDALQYLAHLAEANDWQILFKPHPLPLVQKKQTKFEALCSDKVDFVTGANIFECIRESDLTVTILSSVSYLALIHGHPVLLLGRSPLSKKGCAYEVESEYEIEEAIRKALRDNFTKNQRKQWMRHVAQVCKYYLFSFEEDIANLIGRDVDDAARYLMFHCRLPLPLYNSKKIIKHNWWLNFRLTFCLQYINLKYSRLNLLLRLLRLLRRIFRGKC